MSMLKQVKKDFKDGMTQQTFANECDINEIMERSKTTGLQMAGINKQPIFMDTTEIPDYRTSLQIVKDAQEAFMTLDPKIRDKFDNDPAKMLDFIESIDSDEKYAEGVKLGLLKEKEVVIEKSASGETAAQK